jgi:hypothetical protein
LLLLAACGLFFNCCLSPEGDIIGGPSSTFRLRHKGMCDGIRTPLNMAPSFFAASETAIVSHFETDSVSDHCFRPLFQTSVSDHCFRPCFSPFYIHLKKGYRRGRCGCCCRS